jgi:hypothetical protein
MTQKIKNMLKKQGLDVVYDKITGQWLIYGKKKSYQAERGKMNIKFVNWVLDQEA